MAMNYAAIMGRFVKDPELRRTQSGKAVVSFTLACDKPGKDNGASFIPCVAWEKTGEFIDTYFSKGSAIVIEGRLESRQYETKEGQKRSVLEVVVSQAHFCGKKEEQSEYTGFVKNADVPQNDFQMLDGDNDVLPF